MPRLLIAAFAFAAIAASCGADDPGTGPDDNVPPDTTDSTPVVRTIPVTLGSRVVHAELATTFAERTQGLMGRTSLPDSAGMLFVFGLSQELSFWMKDTPIDLDIAFVDSTRTILNIEGMTALDQVTFHRSAGLARYALEVRRGWFASHGITAGTKLSFSLPPGTTIDP
jgi:uncharacterized membrane protein (UPF0127 family)